MSNVLGHLEPKKVFANFEAMNQIPRASYHEEAVSNWLKEFGEKLGLETIQDKVCLLYTSDAADDTCCV